MYVCMLICLFGPITYCKSHPALICAFCIMHQFKKDSRIGVEDMNHKQCTPGMATASTEATNAWAYQFSG